MISHEYKNGCFRIDMNIDLDLKKVQSGLINNLYSSKIEDIPPFFLMPVSVFVYLQANEKLVSVKRALDFFTPYELNKFKSFKYFYFSDDIKKSFPFSQSGLKVKSFLNLKVSIQDIKKKKISESHFPGDSYFLSQQIFRGIAPLWLESGSSCLEINPFLVSVFVNELCPSLEEEKLVMARERDVRSFEKAILISSLSIFLVLHLGYCNLKFLADLRSFVFYEIVFGKSSFDSTSEINELIYLSSVWIENSEFNSVQLSFLKKHKKKSAQKIISRLEKERVITLTKLVSSDRSMEIQKAKNV